MLKQAEEGKPVVTLRDPILRGLKEVISESQNHLLSLFENEKLNEDDLNKMSTVTVNLFGHLYDKFFEYNQSISGEVHHMVKSLLDVEAVKRSRMQGMLEGKMKGKAEGKIEGNAEGKIESKIEDLMEILQAKQFANDEITAIVANEKDLEKLTEWVVAAATATDYAEFKRVVIGRA